MNILELHIFSLYTVRDTTYAQKQKTVYTKTIWFSREQKYLNDKTTL